MFLEFSLCIQSKNIIILEWKLHLELFLRTIISERKSKNAIQDLNIRVASKEVPKLVPLSSICCLCLREMEIVDHLFLYREFAWGWGNLFSIFWMASCIPKKIDEWMMEGFDGGSFCVKGKILRRCATHACCGAFGKKGLEDVWR